MFRIFRALLVLASWPMLAHAVDSHLIYLNNCKPNGCVVHPGNDNAVTHTSSIPNQQSTVTAFAFSDDTFGRTVGCLRAAFARYDVSITTVDPGQLPRREMMIAGSPQDIGMPGGTDGVAPFTGQPIDNAIAYTFANTVGDDPDGLCWTAANQLGHLYGLDNEHYCPDLMGGARAGFIDSTVPAVNRGEIPGPRVYTAFLVDGSADYNGFVLRTPDEARALVGLAKTNGYDFIKVYVDLAADVFAALAEQGKALGLPLVGHGVRSVRLESQLAQGQTLVAHAEEFFYAYFTPRGVPESDDPPSRERIGGAVALAAHSGATFTADLATYAAIAHQIGHPEVVASFLTRPESACRPGRTWARRSSRG